MKTLLYRIFVKPKSISVILILLLAAGRMNINHVAWIGSVMYLIHKISGITTDMTYA